jgi:hypothetical protein
MAAGEGTSTGLGLLVRPEEIQGLPGPGLGHVGLPRGVASGPGSSSPQGNKRLSCEHLLTTEIGDSTPAKSAPEGTQGEVQSSADLLQVDYCRRSDAVRGGGGGRHANPNFADERYMQLCATPIYKLGST